MTDPGSMKARHPVAGEVGSLLRRAGAPEELAEWAEGKPIDRAWDECLRADWLVWLAAIDRVPLVALVDGARAAVERVVELQSTGQEPLVRAIAAAKELKSNAECRAAADECEARAGADDATTYRKPPNDPYGWAARAAAFLAEAADALLSAEAKRAGDQDLAGMGKGAAVGVADYIVTRGDMSPLVFDLDDELSYGCVAAAEGCAMACVRALLPEGGSVDEADQATETVANDLFEVLDPVRDGMKRGDDPLALVRPLQAKLYSDEGDEPIDQIKRPMMSAAAAVLVPIGGGHYNAGRTVTGAILTVGVALQLVLPLPLAWAVIVLGDAALARAAVRRKNAGEADPTTGGQAAVGVGLVTLAYALAHLIARIGIGA